MSASEQNKPTHGMIAAVAGCCCALVAGIVIRDYSTSWLVRLAVPTLAGFVGMVVAFKACEVRSRGRD